MDPTVPNTDALLTFAGLTLVVTAIVEMVMRAWRPSPDQKDRFGPLLAVGIAEVIAIAVALYLSRDVVQAAITALFAGLASMGFYKAVKTGYEVAGG